MNFRWPQVLLFSTSLLFQNCFFHNFRKLIKRKCTHMVIKKLKSLSHNNVQAFKSIMTCLIAPEGNLQKRFKTRSFFRMKTHSFAISQPERCLHISGSNRFRSIQFTSPGLVVMAVDSGPSTVFYWMDVFPINLL